MLIILDPIEVNVGPNSRCENGGAALAITLTTPSIVPPETIYVIGTPAIEYAWTFEELATWSEDCGARDILVSLTDLSSPPDGILSIVQVDATLYKLRIEVLTVDLVGDYDFVYSLFYAYYPDDFKVSPESFRVRVFPEGTNAACVDAVIIQSFLFEYSYTITQAQAVYIMPEWPVEPVECVPTLAIEWIIQYSDAAKSTFVLDPDLR